MPSLLVASLPINIKKIYLHIARTKQAKIYSVPSLVDNPQFLYYNDYLYYIPANA